MLQQAVPESEVFSNFSLTCPPIPATVLPMSSSELTQPESAESADAHAVTDLAWFCLRTQLKHEHIAAANLRLLPEVEVFNPRIRYRRSTRRGPVWFTESLFPSYIFARFDWRNLLRQVHHAAGVASVVHFGIRWPTIPDEVLAELKETVGEKELRLVAAEPQIGEEVQISGGAFHGLQGIVTRLLPARTRVAILLDFLGRQTMVEVRMAEVVRLPSGEAFVRQRHQPR
jgi:transcriptional antiterminator RfaH